MQAQVGVGLELAIQCHDLTPCMAGCALSSVAGSVGEVDLTCASCCLVTPLMLTPPLVSKQMQVRQVTTMHHGPQASHHVRPTYSWISV